MATNLMDRVRQTWVKKENWPPKDVRPHWEEIEGYRRRYRNDRAELIQNNPNISIDEHKVEIFTPVPWPRELCRFSAALLFSETPRVHSADSTEALDRIEEVNDFGAFAVRGGVLVASEGRCGIRVIRDSAVSPDVPLLTLIPEDQVLWDIRHGAFYVGGMVIIERHPDPDSSDTYRLLEEHTAGLVTRHLYKGGDRTIGKEVPLSTLSEFDGLEAEELTGLDRPTLIPWENVPGGESDMFALGPLFDEANEAESLLVDRGRKSIPRLFVDRSLADDTGRVKLDGVIFTGGARMKLPLGAAPSSTVELADPKFQSVEHIHWIDHIDQMLVTLAGYSPLTWGIQGQTANVTRAVSGYALKLSQLRTLLNRSAKEHMAMQALGWAIATAIAWMSDQSSVSKCLPSIELGDGLPSDPLDGAQEVLYLHQAMAASTETLVKTVHPTWTPEEINAEVDAIVESGIFPPGGGAATGVGPIPKKVKDILDAKDLAGGGIDPTNQP